MTIQSVVIKVGGIPQTVIFDLGLQAYTATLPLQPVDFYEVEIQATDMASVTTTTITFLSIAQGEIAKFKVLNSMGDPVADVKITAYHRNPSGGTDFGRAEEQVTDANGEAFLHLVAGNYNVKIERDGFSTKVVNNFQVISGINVFDAGGTIPHTHIVNTPAGVPIQDASVKIEDMTLAANLRLIAHRKTDALGSWTANLPPNNALVFTFEKAGSDFQKAGVQSA